MELFNRREKFIVLDVEGGSNVRPYNIGYIIADKYGKIYEKRSFALLECLWENISSALKYNICVDMMKKNAQDILADTKQKKRKRKYLNINANEFYNTFARDIKKYKISVMYAYNVTFDKSSLTRLLGERFTDLKLECRDIIRGILPRLLTKKYITYCIDNNYLTEKGNYQYKAEIVYRYLTGNSEFEEEHTGLADVMIEYDILLNVFKSRKSINWNDKSPIWKNLKNFAKERGIE